MSRVVSPQVIDVPTWQPDEDTTECGLCHREFTIFFRRHHCRKCGRVLCGDCSSNLRNYLPSTYVVCPPTQIFLESPHVPHRTCDQCAQELDMIRQALEPQENVSNVSRVNYETVSIDVPKSGGLVREATMCVDENDYCPVCSKTISDLTEDQRENHISDCLSHAQFLGSPETTRSPNRMLVYRLPKDFKPRSTLDITHDRPQGNLATGMVTSTYNSDDEENECCICLEDFHPDEKVGRLECLCMFHYKCISDWFERRGPGECPVHAVH